MYKLFQYCSVLKFNCGIYCFNKDFAEVKHNGFALIISLKIFSFSNSSSISTPATIKESTCFTTVLPEPPFALMFPFKKRFLCRTVRILHTGKTFWSSRQVLSRTPNGKVLNKVLEGSVYRIFLGFIQNPLKGSFKNPEGKGSLQNQKGSAYRTKLQNLFRFYLEPIKGFF